MRRLHSLRVFFDTNEQVQFHNAVSLQDTFMRVLSEFISGRRTLEPFD